MTPIKKSIIIKTKNPYKIEDYKAFNIPNLTIIEPSDEIPEVDGSMMDIITYKTLDAQLGELVEDSIIVCQGKEYIDIKNKIFKVPEKTELLWVVNIGYRTETHIEIYQGISGGYLFGNSIIQEGKSYDMNMLFIPIGEKTCIKQLKNWQKYTPRYNALLNFEKGKKYHKIAIKDIPAWKGKYQLTS